MECATCVSELGGNKAFGFKDTKNEFVVYNITPPPAEPVEVGLHPAPYSRGHFLKILRFPFVNPEIL